MTAGPWEFFSDFNAGLTGPTPEELDAHPEILDTPEYLAFQYLMGLREEIADERGLSIYDARKILVNRARKALGISRAELLRPRKYTNVQVADALRRQANESSPRTTTKTGKHSGAGRKATTKRLASFVNKRKRRGTSIPDIVVEWNLTHAPTTEGKAREAWRRHHGDKAAK